MQTHCHSPQQPWQPVTPQIWKKIALATSFYKRVLVNNTLGRAAAEWHMPAPHK
jgi:hypothetical protein